MFLRSATIRLNKSQDITKATSPALQSANRISVWKTLPDTPLVESAAASLSGSLLAVGGWDDKTPVSPAVHVFLPLTNSWVRVTTGDLPEHAMTALQYSYHPTNYWLLVGVITTENIPRLYSWGPLPYKTIIQFVRSPYFHFAQVFLQHKNRVL